ncbi:hemagglutinin repeat-containing protein [Herbaspirillum sp. YR522]|uniref:hemagglutinin repeat-containing protein n=1 Tax=Herbaspirillum sp. YR522 TaxID=1144342 RepID=UPI0002F337A6|nr:hemagglutinin repeat-containing protein [Herbaspirillum sp. YR522]
MGGAATNTGNIGANGTTTLTAGSLDNRGTLHSTQAGTAVTVNGRLENGGTLSANQGLSVQAGGAVVNTGDIGANGTTTLVAGTLDNRGTLNSTQASAVVTVAGRLDNSGTLSANQALSVQAGDAVANTGTIGANGATTLIAGALDNRGKLNSIQASVGVTATGPVVNRGGIEAAQGIALNAGGIDNSSGAISANDIAIDSDGRALNNAGGRIVAQNALSISSGELNNDAGLLQAIGSIAIDAHGQTVSNTNSGSTQGIISQGTLNATAGAIVNRGGYLGSGGDMLLTAATVDNGAGVIGSMAKAAVNAATLVNTGGKMQAKDALSINAVAGSVDNGSGLLRSDGTVTIESGTLRNDNTQGTDQGIEGAAVAINARGLSNRLGAIRTDTSLTVESHGSIDNTAGLLSSSGLLALRDTQAARTLAVDNTDGTIIAARQVDIVARALTGTGRVLSQKDLNIDLVDSILNRGQIAATGDATVTTAGTFTNAGTVAAGATLALTAATIDNQAAGSLLADTLKLKATDVHTFINRGLIDGTNTIIESSTVNNIGTGRIYGDNVAIGADVLNNLAETVDGTTTAAVIAARNRLDIGAGVINNSEHALLYSVGDMAIGGALDAAKRATGMAREINNSSATINADGNLTIAASTINNTNAHLETTDQVGPGNRIVTYRLNGSPNMIDGNSAYLVNMGSGQTVAATNWRAMGDEDNFRLVLPSSAYPVERYGPPFDYSRGVKSGDNAIAPAYVPAWESGSAGSEAGITYYPEIINYSATDRIWSVMGVTPPPDPGAGPGAEPRPGEVCYESCYSVPVDASVQAAWQAAYADWKPKYDAYKAALLVLDEKISAFNSNVQSRSVREWTIYDGTEQITRTVVTKSDPGMITAGGNMTLAAGTVNNLASQIIAGGTVAGDAVNGTAINNIGPLGVQSVTSTGSASYTYIKSHAFSADDRRYDDAAYQSQTIVTNFQLDITPTNGAGPSRDNTVKAVNSAVPGASGQAATAMTIRTANLSLILPNNALYRTNPMPGSRTLIQTDPQFTSYRTWQSSDFMLMQLPSTPDSTIKRLGDGFYEQQVVQQQIQQAIGQRYLAGYTSNEAQYVALMTAGVQQGQASNYTVGIALTDAQIAQLTSDMVWMVKQTVTLSDGSTQEVLVPQVYLRADSVEVTGQGTLIAGNNVAFQTAQDIVNSGGTIAARQGVSLVGNNVQNLGGRISGADTALVAATDINNLGGAIDGSSSVTLLAGRDINTNSTSVDTANAVTSGTNINQVASITGGNLALAAGRDLTANAAVIAATGDASLSAGRDVKLGTVNQNYRQEINWATDSGGSNWVSRLTGPNLVDQANGAHGTGEAGVNRATLSASQDVATQVTGNNITISAGQDLVAKGTQVVAEAALTAAAGRDITLSTANESASARDQHQHSSSSILSASSTRTDDASSYSNQIGSTFSGNTTVLAAGRDASIIGSDVVSTKGTQVTAGNNLDIAAATNTSSESHYRKEITSGVFSGGGLGVTVGSKMQSTDFTRNATTASGSTVGATDGNVALVAGNLYNQIGSNVLAPAGDIDIVAKTVRIIAAAEASKTVTEDKFKQSGVTLAVTSPIISALQTVQQMGEAAGKTKDGRMKALAAATAGRSLYDAAQGAQSAAADPKSAGFGLSITAGGSENASTTEQNSLLQKGSTVASGGNTSIRATGASTNSNITIQGSDVTAGGNLALKADNDINLLAAQNVDEQHSNRSSSSYGVGLAIQFGQGGASLGITANAAGSRGNSDGRDVANTLTHLKAGGQVSLDAGRDANLVGATVAADQVKADIGRNLNIESVQDTSTFKSQDQSIGGSMTVGAGFSGSVSASQSKVDANYASVGEQSGINAGDGGFQVNVKGNTDLKGGKIASTDKAMEDGKNSLTTGTLTVSEIENRSQYQAESQSASAGGGNWANPSQGKPGGGIGIGSTSGDERSTTRSGVSGGAVTITDAQAQQDKTGQSAEQTIALLDQDVRTGKDSSNTLNKNWNGDELRDEVEAQAKITQAFGQRAAKMVGDIAGAKRDELKKAADDAERRGDTALAAKLSTEAKDWDEGGIYRVAIHTAIGALGGGLEGALGAAASAQFMPTLANEIKQMGLSTEVQSVVELAAAAGMGAVVGGTAGAANGFNVELSNRQLTHTEKDRIKKLADGDTKKEERLTAAACAATKCWAEYATESAEFDYYKSMADWGNTPGLATERGIIAQQQGLFDYSASDKASDFGKWIANSLAKNGDDAAKIALTIIRRGPNSLPPDLPLDGSDSGGPTGTAGAVITPSIPLCLPTGVCVVAPPIAVPASVYASIGESDNKGRAEQILDAERIGSGLKEDPSHRAASFLSKEQLESGQVFSIRGGDGIDRILLQTPGAFNGKNGIYEYIYDVTGKVTHQRFIEGGKITGAPNQRITGVVK